jgi:hypothetical protein
MKTDVEIEDLLLRDARALAARDGTTVGALVEEGLRARLAPFRLRDASFGGSGLQPEAAAAGCGVLREWSYED